MTDNDDFSLEMPAEAVPEPSATTYTAPPLDVGHWLVAYVQGTTKDQNTVLLDRIIKERVAQSPRAKAPRTVDINAEISRFLTRYENGEVPSESPLAAQLAELIARNVPMSMSLSAAPSMDTALQEEVQTLEAKVAALEEECKRAHDWRYHLETHARSVEDNVVHLARVLKRAPTRDELEGILATLRAAIRWSPSGGR